MIWLHQTTPEALPADQGQALLGQGDDLKSRLYSDGGPEGAQATVAQRYEHKCSGRPEAKSKQKPI